MTTTSPPLSPPVGDPLAVIAQITEQLRALREIEWVGVPGDGAGEALVALEAVDRAHAALRAELVAAAEASGLWALDGSRTFPAWLSGATGASRTSASRALRLARALRDFLPRTRAALAEGVITVDHAELLARTCTRTDRHRTLLGDEECGEAFLVAAATELDATAFSKVAAQWAVMTDPEAADRAWREANATEEVYLAPTTGGYLLSGWLSEESGQILTQALEAHMGRKAADDLRSIRQRRAGALVDIARHTLDSGAKLRSARIRPHLTVTMTYDTLTALAQATGPAGLAAPSGQVPEWMRTWVPGGDHVINTGLDYDLLRGVQPATFPDGTPLAPTLLARLTCESMIARVVFGADSTVLDSGREERLFTASQVRAIIARDKHCQYPGCDAPPGFGEIHHSAEWFKHNGSTHVDLGILLCWFHHGLVHERGITIHRISGQWVFTDRGGSPLSTPDHTELWPPDPHPPPF